LKYLVKFTRLKLRDQFLLLQTFMLLVVFRIILLTVKFKVIARHLGVHMQESDNKILKDDLPVLQKVSWAVAVMSCFTPWPSKCFVQALTAKWLLKSRNIKCTIYFGLKKDDQGKMCAHAWLRSGQTIVCGGNSADFVQLSTFGDL